MPVEQSARNMGVHWNTVFNRLIRHIKVMVRFIMIPWMVLLFIMIAGVVEEWATGDLGRNGGMTEMFQGIGLHPHAAYEVFLCITGFGVFPAASWLLWNLLVAGVGVAGRQMQNTGMKEWFAQKAAPLQKGFADYEKAHPESINTLFTGIVAALMIAIVPFLILFHAPKSRMVVWPHGGPVPGVPQIKVLTHSYGHVLLEMQAPAGKQIEVSRTISGKAIVTQAGPHVYRVRIIP